MAKGKFFKTIKLFLFLKPSIVTNVVDPDPHWIRIHTIKIGGKSLYGQTKIHLLNSELLFM